MRRLLTVLASLRLTVLLLVLGMTLVLGGTFAQRAMGSFAAQETYFSTWLVWLPVPGFTSGTVPLFPGGFLLGILLIINLVAVCWLSRRQALRQPSFLLTHGGLIILMGGVLANSIWSVESYMEISEGGSAAYSLDFRRTELVALRTLPDQTNQVTSFPEEAFGRAPLSAADLPFTIHLVRQYPDTILSLSTGANGQPVYARAPAPKAVLDNGQRCLTVDVEVLAGAQAIGRYWLTCAPVWNGVGMEDQALTPVTVNGQTWQLALRLRRYYSGQTVTLRAFKHEVYPGSDIPAKFASTVDIADAASGERRTAVIAMNQPLRFHGRTYYQSGFKNNDRTTVLQVVRNPGWLLPYVSCTLIALGMALGFWGTLRRYLARRRSDLAADPAASSAGWRQPAGLAAIALAVVALLGCLAQLRTPGPEGQMNIAAFGTLPVLADGRMKPLDSIARNELLQLHGKQQVRSESGTLSAAAWLLQLIAQPSTADLQKIFVIDHPEVLGMMGFATENGRYYSYNELTPYLAEIDKQAQQATANGEPTTPFGKAITNLAERLLLYNRLKNSFQPGMDSDFTTALLSAEATAKNQWAPELLASAQFISESAALYPIPPAAGSTGTWISPGAAIVSAGTPSQWSPVARGYAELLRQYHAGDAAGVNRALASLHGLLDPLPASAHAAAEARYNHAAPFYLAMCLYVGVFLLMLAAWLRWWEFGRRAAFALLLVALLVHTSGLVWRVWLQGYAPVTNLYSSAVFVGWMAALLSLFLEWRHRHGVGNVTGAVIGFSTLIVAHHLASGGETMEMMRAVLASNFWLSTHVVTIAMGYSAMFFAGAVATFAIVRDALVRHGARSVNRLASTVYGIICFATLLSFVGTILGGIWADQSWGRFWGWDPKENGALLIVCWCAILLHARLGRFLSDRTLHLLAIGGNIVTAFSWFGVNLLGVGLHSYGFTTSGLFWLLAFMASQVLLLGLGLLGPQGPALAAPAAARGGGTARSRAAQSSTN